VVFCHDLTQSSNLFGSTITVNRMFVPGPVQAARLELDAKLPLQPWRGGEG